MATSYQPTNLGGRTYSILRTLDSLCCVIRMIPLQRDLTTGVVDTKLHQPLTNLGLGLQPSLRILACSFQTTQPLKDALPVGSMHQLNPLHRSEHSTNLRTFHIALGAHTVYVPRPNKTPHVLWWTSYLLSNWISASCILLKKQVPESLCSLLLTSKQE